MNPQQILVKVKRIVPAGGIGNFAVASKLLLKHIPYIWVTVCCYQLLSVEKCEASSYQWSSFRERVYDKVENGFLLPKKGILESINQKHFFFFFCSVKTDLLKDGAISRLYIAFASKRDTGNYTCSMRNAQASVFVHILDGMYTLLSI